MQSPNTQSRLTPVYVTKKPGEAFALFDGNLTLVQGTYTGNGLGSINVVWVSSPRVRVELSSLQPSGIVQLGKAQIQFLGGLGDAEIDVTSAHYSSLGPTVGVVGRPIETISVRSGSDAAFALFHVVNYWDFLNPRTASPPVNYDIGRVEFTGGGWRVTLQSVPDIKSIAETLKSESGCAITHVGRLEKIDGSSFSLDAAKEVLTGLHLFLSFSSGIWTPPILYVGFDNSGATVWQEWAVRSATSWKDRLSWFPVHLPACLADVFPGFMSLWQNPDWNEIIRVAIHWYVEANRGSGAVEGGLVMVQTALELLAWYVLVEDRQKLAADAFRKQMAADHFRALFAELNLPVGLPTGWLRIRDLPSLAQAQGLTDASHALTWLRNSIVHPNRRSQTRLQNCPVQVRYECWQLGLWYLEVILLKLFGYAGQYVNRLTIQFIGDTETIP